MGKLPHVLILLILGQTSPLCESLKAEARPQNAVVELLVVCDWKFAYEFQNKEALGLFLHTQILDLNNRLKTLQKTNSQVRVVEIVIPENGLSSEYSKHDLYDKWAAWLYENQNSFPKFDMAIVVLGESKRPDASPGWATSGRMCLVQHSLKLHISMILIKSQKDDPSFPELLAESLVETIAKPGLERKFKSCKKAKTFLLGGKFSRERFFYNECADDLVAAGLKETNTRCMLDNANTSNILDKYSQMGPTTLHGQCAYKLREYRSPNAVLTRDSCVVSKCSGVIWMGFSGVRRNLGKISPVDNSECDTNLYCFKGNCLPRGQQIRNVQQEKCVSSENWFGIEETVSLIQCTSAATLMDADSLIIDYGKVDGKRVMKAYGEPYNTKISYKCLTVDKYSYEVHFTECDDNDDKFWQLVRAKPKGNVFMLFHTSLHACAYINDMQQIVASPICNALDAKFLWEFADKSILSGFIDSVLQNGIGLEESGKFCFGSWIRSLLM